jgi:hypothetical protein
MKPTDLATIAVLTGEPCHPCQTRAVTYAVSLSWVVWWRGGLWHAVHRSSCHHRQNAWLMDCIVEDLGVLWSDLDTTGKTLDLIGLLFFMANRGYTVRDVAARLGYVPTNRQVARYLSGKLPPSREFCQRAMAAFGSSVLRPA